MPQPAPHDAVESKLLAARTRLILERPFLGALVLRLPLQAADASWCPTTRTDARTLYYNPASMTRRPNEMQATGHLIFPSFDFTDAGSTSGAGTPI